MLESATKHNVRSLPVHCSPMEMAASLAHLPGLVFLDTSSAGRGEPINGPSCSIVAALPKQILTGNIFNRDDRDLLRNTLRKNEAPGMDLGFPLGGLIGGIEYGGEFYFGVYPEMLIYNCLSHQWVEVGSLSRYGNPQTLQKLPIFNQSIDFRNSLDQNSYCSRVEKAIDYIARGDIYQVNLTHRFETDWNGSAFENLALYRKFREVSPAPFAGFFEIAGKTILSTSPEQFLRISGRTIETRPIKGTRPRFRDRERDEKSAYDLITSPKEIAELIMITDLERNDLGQICDFGTVEATELLKLERFAQVFHLVSTVQGCLRAEVDHVEAVAACFPGGSITGAPKKRAREIIAELETVPRGLYTGSLGCFGFNRESLFNIVIRTAVADGGKMYFNVGAGIVADSNPEAEWKETLQKASGFLQAATAETRLHR
jgi:para-aminobenzoate synthetase component I